MHHNRLTSRPNLMYTDTKRLYGSHSATRPSRETTTKCAGPRGAAQSSECDAAKVKTCFARSESGLSCKIAITSSLCIKCASPAASNTRLGYFKLLSCTQTIAQAVLAYAWQVLLCTRQQASCMLCVGRQGILCGSLLHCCEGLTDVTHHMVL